MTLLERNIFALNLQASEQTIYGLKMARAISHIALYQNKNSVKKDREILQPSLIFFFQKTWCSLNSIYNNYQNRKEALLMNESVRNT